MSSEQQQQPSRPVRRGPVKLNLRSPTKPPLCKSYTVTPASINEVTVRTDGQTIRTPVEISSAAVAQPFVDPAVLERRRRSGGTT
ncbi:hypothetical protein F4779DRAFT_623517 [Xylariaceae sp. FL0662B]|nr:hypothetical protein F4779DRAFT_623517 [Xylariaceae sp. FL0662B]